MRITGIICEYNPLHLGHAKQLRLVRQLRGADSGIVCLMSGNFVQRGHPAVFDKSLRAKAAILSGADLVLELPVQYALSSAEGFASGGVGILSGFCDSLCFGAENADANAFMNAARALQTPDFSEKLRQQLGKGMSFPAARQAALEGTGIDAALICLPNNILATEYCKAILQQNSPMEPLPIARGTSYHDTAPDPNEPSATALRLLMEDKADWLSYAPAEAHSCFAGAAQHTLHAGERAVLARLRTMTDAEFEALPYGSEGLWRKFMHAARKKATVEEILTSVKSKRYTRTRLDRMLMCAFLGLTKDDMTAPQPYVRVLAFNDRGRAILKQARVSGDFRNAGEAVDSPYWELEQRAGGLYGLFCTSAPEPPDIEQTRRVYYHRG